MPDDPKVEAVVATIMAEPEPPLEVLNVIIARAVRKTPGVESLTGQQLEEVYKALGTYTDKAQMAFR